IDIGATNTKYVLSNIEGEIIYQGSAKTVLTEYRLLLYQISQILSELKNKTTINLSGIGICLPGFIDFVQRKIIQSPNVAILSERNIWDDLTEVVDGLQFVINNDANAAAYGEYILRKKENQTIKDLILVTLGSGVGGGIIVDGNLLIGSRGFGGEIGHIKIKSEGEQCGCGSTGCAEAYLGNKGIVKGYRELYLSEDVESTDSLSLDGMTTEDLANLAVSGDFMAIANFKKTGKYLGQLISILINIFNPQIIAIGGGIVKAADYFFESMIEETRRKSIRPSFDSVSILKSIAGSDTGAFGAAMLARDNKKLG
ncbi:MAG: ROK family protein, partial [Acidobacteria bacterium]|nr:ROK family protein [Acidobacteriota bacterium]